MLDRRDILLAGAFAAASLALPYPAHASSIYPLKATRGERLLLATKVNGHEVEALLDSAAEGSFVDQRFARKIGLAGLDSVTAKGSGEKNFAAPLAKGVTVSAAGLTLRDLTIAITDLADVGQRLLGHPLEMILGREIFDAARLRVDIQRRQIEVLSDSTVPRGEHLPLQTVNGIEVFPARVEGAEVLAALDLGNGSNVLVGSAFAKRRGMLEDGRSITEDKGGGLGGETTRRVIRLKSLEIGGLTLTNIPGSIDEGDSATDLNVGMSVLRNFIVTTDFRAHSLWLEVAQR